MTKPSALQVGGKKAKGRTNKATKTHKRKSMSKKMRHTKKHHKGGRQFTSQPYYDLAKSFSMISQNATIHADNKYKNFVNFLSGHLIYKYDKSTISDKAPGFYIMAFDQQGGLVKEITDFGITNDNIKKGFVFTFTTTTPSTSMFGPAEKPADNCTNKLQENTFGEIKITYKPPRLYADHKIKIQINKINFKDDDAVPHILKQSGFKGYTAEIEKAQIKLAYEYAKPVSKDMGSNSIEFKIKQDAIKKAKTDMLNYFDNKTSVIPNEETAKRAFTELKNENKMVEDKEERYKSMYKQQIDKYINKLKATAYAVPNYQDYLVSYYNVSSIHELESKMNELKKQGSKLEKVPESIGEFSITGINNSIPIGTKGVNITAVEGATEIVRYIAKKGGCGMKMISLTTSSTSNDNGKKQLSESKPKSSWFSTKTK